MRTIPTLRPPQDDVGDIYEHGDDSIWNQNWGSIVFASILYIIAFFVGLTNTEPSGKNWWAVALIAIACHIYLSITVINEREIGAMFRLGQPVRNLGSAPYFAFWPFVYIRKATRNIVQIEVGVLTDQEKQKAKSLEGSASLFLFEESLHINWGSLQSAHYDDNEAGKALRKAEQERYKNDPLAKPLVTATHLTIRFEIFNLIALIRKAGSLEESIELIYKAATSALISYAGKSFVARAIANMEEVEEWLKDTVEEFVADPQSDRYKADPKRTWGVNIRRTQITRIGTAKRISEAQADQGKVVYAAQAERFRLEETAIGAAKATELQAIANRIKFTQEGAGKAEAEKLLLFAQQEGLDKLAEVAETDKGQLVLQLQALERGLEHGKTVILPAELSRIVSVLSDKFGPPPPASLR